MIDAIISGIILWLGCMAVEIVVIYAIFNREIEVIESEDEGVTDSTSEIC